MYMIMMYTCNVAPNIDCIEIQWKHVLQTEFTNKFS